MIILDKTVEKDAYVESLMDDYRGQLEEYYDTVGSTTVNLTDKVANANGGIHGECNMGNAITDSMLRAFDDTTIAFINDGGIRSSIYVGNITGEDIYNVLPFDNTVDKAIISGLGIKALLEDYASQLCPSGDCYAQTFLQTSGLKIVYDVQEKNAGQRVTTLQVHCPDDDGGDDSEAEEVTWCDIDLAANYSVALPSFLSGGGAKAVYDFENEIIELVKGNQTDYEIFRAYVVDKSPLENEVEGRITIKYSGASAVIASAAVVFLLAVVVGTV